MTGLLTEVLRDHAEALEPPRLDVDRIVRDGSRLTVRRRTAAVAVGIAATVVTALAAPAFDDGGDDGTDRLAISEAPVMTWARGEVIHSGADAVDVGHPVRAFVATSVGYVFFDDDGTVWSATQRGVERVGRVPARSGRLVADGARVGWVEFPSGARPEFVFLDQRTGTVTRDREGTVAGMDDLADGDNPAELLALDGRSAYLRDRRGFVRLDLDSGRSAVLGPVASGEAGPTELTDVEGGLLVHTVPADGTSWTVVSARLEDTSPRFELWSPADLSPGGTYLMSENGDDFRVLTVATGADVTPAAKDDYFFFTGYQWIGDGSFSALGLASDDTTEPVDLLTCTVADGACTVTGDDLVRYGDFQLPVGEHLGD